MVQDVSPEILERIEKEYELRFYNNATVKRIYKRIQNCEATMNDVRKLTEIASKAAYDSISYAYEKAYGEGMLPNGVLYQNIVEKTLIPTMEESGLVIGEAFTMVQNDINKKAGLGLKAVHAPFDEERAEGLAKVVTNLRTAQLAGTKAKDQIENFLLVTLDQYIQTNIDFQKNAGLHPKINRVRGAGENEDCEFCAKLVYSGEYEAATMPIDIFRRHRGCKCIVTFDSGTGRLQGVHSKQIYADYASAQKKEREYLAELDKMSAAERKRKRNQIRNERDRAKRRAAVSQEQWQRNVTLQKIIAQKKDAEKARQTRLVDFLK